MSQKTEQKATTHKRILKASGKVFRSEGYEGASIPRVMEEAGLTVGGFYNHFESKAALLAETMETSVKETGAFLRDIVGDLRGKEWLKAVAQLYLSPKHRDNLSGGCAIPPLTSDVARADAQVREVYERALLAFVGDMEERAPEGEYLEGREHAWAFMALMVGGLMLSRGVLSDDVSREILDACKKAAEFKGGER